MLDNNVQEQESRYTSLRKGNKKLTSSFRLLFDNQLLANKGAGVAAVGDAKRALEFIFQMDPKRYGTMLAQMRNDAQLNVPEAYPQTLTAADSSVPVNPYSMETAVCISSRHCTMLLSLPVTRIYSVDPFANSGVFFGGISMLSLFN
jgi:hypothetical protein